MFSYLQGSKGWVPKQHGAWAMMIVPFLLGLIAAGRADALGWGHLTLFAFWMLGYFAFNAASGWLKAAKRQRPKYFKPLLIYSAAAALFGLLTLLLTGLRPLPWALAFVPLIVPAFWLAGNRKERATIGGFLTIAAAALMVPVARYLYPSSTDDWPHVTATAVLIFAYFFGTVLFVKTNIRERGSKTYLVASIAYHAAIVVLAVVLAALGLAGWWWTPVLVAVLIRAIIVPPMRLKPMVLGIGEIVVCLAILALAIAFG